MDSTESDERRRKNQENARKQLADKTWPQVMMVFGYQNPRAPRVSDEDISRIKGLFVNAGCKNIPAFIDLVQFEEKEHNVTRSYNFSTRWRFFPEDISASEKNAMTFMLSKDMLIGTRAGVEGALDWLDKLSKELPEAVPEQLQVLDMVFGEAVESLRGPSHTATAEEMLQAVFSEDSPLMRASPAANQTLNPDSSSGLFL